MKIRTVLASIFLALLPLAAVMQCAKATASFSSSLANEGASSQIRIPDPDTNSSPQSMVTSAKPAEASDQTGAQKGKEPGVRSRQLSHTETAPTITLRAVSGATISFKTQNGRTVKSIPPQTMDLPHLVLYRDGTLTPALERTLILTVGGLYPTNGVTVTLDVWTQHGDPDLGSGYGKIISVWRESRRIQYHPDNHQEAGLVVFAREFSERTASGAQIIATPTDYFQIRLTVTDDDHPWSDPLAMFHQDYAFLMENQWNFPLPEVKEATLGAAPDELVLYFCDMVPFRKNVHDHSVWIRRDDVAGYIQTKLAPAMIEAFRLQTDDWDFRWYSAWTNPRPGGDPEKLTVALTDGQAWFHGQAPPLANSHISIRTIAAEYHNYDTLTDGLMSAFHHELFHNLQRNISQHFGGRTDLMGAEGRWLFFTEGTAMLASSVGQQTQQFASSLGERAFISRANEFLGQEEGPGELNASYSELFPYRAGLYWRFLYEQCGGMTNGVEDPAAGMRVVRHSLETLFSKEIVDISISSQLVEKMPRILDEVFASEETACPFTNYTDSLLHFARAIYALRMDGGRCSQPGFPVGCGIYDPNRLYADPPVSQITYSGAAFNFSGTEETGPAGISSSFGIDFVEVNLGPEANGKPVRLEFQPTPGVAAEFAVQLLIVADSENGMSPSGALSQDTAPELLASEKSGGRVAYLIPAVHTAAYTKLALIIVRIDSNEGRDPVGQYVITMSRG